MRLIPPLMRGKKLSTEKQFGGDSGVSGGGHQIGGTYDCPSLNGRGKGKNRTDI